MQKFVNYLSSMKFQCATINKMFYTISPGKQSTIIKLYHLTFLLNSSSNKLDHVPSFNE